MDETLITVPGAGGFDLAALVEAAKGHTPAPWSVPHFADSDAKCECGYVFAREDAKTVCEVNYHDFRDKDDEHLPRPEAAANAHLIAAAPALLAHAQAQARRIEELEAERDALKGQGYVAEAAVESEHEAYADLKAETARLRKALRDIEGIAWGKDTMISGLRKRIAAIAAAEAAAPGKEDAHGQG